jgi:hypothetical protein
MGANLAQNPHGKPDRWIIDFASMSIEDASQYKLPLERLQKTIPLERQSNRNQKLKDQWWLYEGRRLGMRTAIAPLSCYFSRPLAKKLYGIVKG